MRPSSIPPLAVRYDFIWWSDQIINDFLSSDYLAFSAYPPRHIDQITSQTLTLRAQYYGNADMDMSLYEVAVLEGQRFTDQRGCLYSYYGFYIRRERSSMGTIDYLDVKVSIDGKTLGFLGSGLKNLNSMQHFHCAFVQDCEKSPATWTLYVNGAPVGKMTGSINAMSRWKSLLSGGISCDKLMTGKVRSTNFLSFSPVT